MLYAILWHHDETVAGGRTNEEDDAVLVKRELVTVELAEQGRLGPAARLMPTTAATTVRSGSEPRITDGPFAGTEERLLGFYIIECASNEDAVDVARRRGRDQTGTSEIRPLRLFRPGSA